MGLFQARQRPTYRQENAMSNANALTSLLALKSEQADKAVNTVDEIGKIQQRQKVSQLFGQDDYKNLDSMEAQAKILGLTGGRDLGKYFGAEIGQSYGAKDARTLAEEKTKLQAQKDAQAMQRLFTNHNLSMTRQKQAQGAKEALLGNTDDVRSRYMETISKVKDPAERAKLIQEGFLNGAFDKNDRIAFEKLFPKVWEKATGTKSTSTKNANKRIESALPKRYKLMPQKSYDGLTSGLNSGFVFMKDLNAGKTDSQGKALYPELVPVDKRGKVLGPKDLEKYIGF